MSLCFFLGAWTIGRRVVTTLGRDLLTDPSLFTLENSIVVLLFIGSSLLIGNLTGAPASTSMTRTRGRVVVFGDLPASFRSLQCIRTGMPTVQFRGRSIDCEAGEVLRDVLLDAGESPHNGLSDTVNCRGNATCGTCAVEVEGDVGEPTAQERRRLSFPPHDFESGLRLACQTTVEGDVSVTKHPGFWGQKVEKDA